MINVKSKLYVSLLILNIIICVNCSIETNYYNELIRAENQKVLNYVSPKGNYEFENGLNSKKIIDFGTFDFIIVGAGSAGGVLATRLSEVDNFTILLIETGGEENDYSQILGFSSQLKFDENFNWGYYSTSQKFGCLGMKNQQCFIAKGKAIGGSSSINNVIYSRGNAKDYDNWEALGNPGWSYKSVLPYFKKSENSQINYGTKYHGIGGFWNVEYSTPASNFFDVYINASREINIPYLDYHGPEQLGISRIQINTKYGRRQSTGAAFLKNARKRNNLKVITRALATKVIFKNHSAVGIEFVTRTQKFQANASKEVILSAGVFNTPQLLMLSGIGPKEELERLGINIVHNLPVGKTLFDQPIFPFLIETNYSSVDTNLNTQIEDYLHGVGSLTKASGADGLLFMNPNNKSKIPTIEIIAPSPGGNLTLSVRVSNYNNTIAKMFQNISSPNLLTLPITLLHAKSVGQVTLQSNNIIDFPNINLNYFEQQDDVDELIKGIRFAINMIETEAFQNVGAKLLKLPICEEFQYLSNKYWDCIVRTLTSNTHHQCGSTRMGVHHNVSVVNHNLEVHGVTKLRVVDTGVFPTSLSGHTNAAVIMVAEKISDTIKKQYGEL